MVAGLFCGMNYSLRYLMQLQQAQIAAQALRLHIEIPLNVMPNLFRHPIIKATLPVRS